MDSDKDHIALHFGNTLRSYRMHAQLSQERLGQLASLHRTEIGLLERGTRVPRIDTLIKLASALSITTCELLAGIDWKPDRIQRGGFEFQGGSDVPVG